MQFSLSHEQSLLRETVRDFLERHSPIAAARERLETSAVYDELVWKRLSDELELVSVHVPEEYGGQGFGLVELGLVLEEMGRVAYPGPFLSSAAFALPLLLASGSNGNLLEEVRTGRSVATVALSHASGRGGADGVLWSLGPDGPTLSGCEQPVVNAIDADVILILARADPAPAGDPLTLLAVSSSAPGVRIEPLEAVDPTRPFAAVRLEQAPATIVGAPHAGAAFLGSALPGMRACLAAELLGVAARSLELVVEYVAARQQFGVAVGSFQAVQHRCADMLVAVEEARSLTYHALWAVSAQDRELEISSSIALAVSLTVAEQVTRAAIQLQGGVAFTWEHDAHLYFRRAAAAPGLLGSARRHRRTVAELAFGIEEGSCGP